MRTLSDKVLAVVCVACGAWAMSFGLGTQVISHWLKHEGYSDTAIGLNHTLHYVGLALGSLLAPYLLRSCGRACPILALLFSAGTLAGFPLGNTLTGYGLLRLLNGVAGALTVIPLETALGRGGHPDARSRSFACYGVALTLGGAIGIWIGLSAYVPGDAGVFLLGGALPVAGAGVLTCWFVLPPAKAEIGEKSAAIPWRGNVLSFGTAWCQGFLEGGMLAFLSLYLLSLGMTTDAAGGLVGLSMAGVIVFQLPVSWLADRCGRGRVLLGCYAVVALALWWVPYCEDSWVLAAWLFALGACAGAMYPLGLSLLSATVSDAALPRAYACYLAIECVGSQLGAAVMGQGRDWWGEASMFAVGLAAVGLVLAAWGVVRLREIAPSAWPGLSPRSPGEAEALGVARPESSKGVPNGDVQSRPSKIQGVPPAACANPAHE
jgi:MFS family permease